MVQETFLILPTSLLCLYLIVVTLSRKNMLGVHKRFLMLALSMFVYTICHFIYINLTQNSELEAAELILYTELLGISALSASAASIFLLAASFAGKNQLTHGWRTLAVFSPTILTALIISSNPLHHLFRSGATTGPLHILVQVIVLVSGLALTAGGLAIYSNLMLEAKDKACRMQATIMALGSIIPILGSLAWLIFFRIQASPPLIANPLPYTSLVSALIFAYGINRQDILDIFPIALKEIFYSMSDAVLIIDRKNNILQANGPAKRLFPKLSIGDSLASHAPELAEQLALQGNRDQLHTPFEIKLGRSVIWARTIPLHVQDEMAGALLLLSDVTERKQIEEQLEHNVLHDRLTNLPNRTLIMQRLEQIMAYKRRRPDYQFAILILDLDRFKIVNDSLGHIIGDELLVAVAGRLENCLREYDTLARLSGDEFIILLESITDESSASRVARRVLSELSAPFQISGHEIYVTASIGIATGQNHYEWPEEILRDADIAMYRAKDLGTSRCTLFDRKMHERVNSILQLEADLRRAIEQEAFELHYQPIVNLQTGQIVGFEALVRWRHPSRGLIYPGFFIPEAEESGLIIPLGRWVLREACQQLSTWRTAFPDEADLIMSINLSAVQLRDPLLADHLRTILETTNVPAGCLALEITESTIIENNEIAAALLSDLKDIGVQMHVDDFGTGFSSLDVLHRFPVDAIKIDRSFVKISPSTNALWRSCVQSSTSVKTLTRRSLPRE